MNSEKVKEIKELLLRKAKEYESQTLLDILTLINELESENERLNKSDTSKEESSIEYYNLYKDFKRENQELKDRIAELENENKDYYDRLNNLQTYIDNHEEIWKGNTNNALKQFAERLKEHPTMKIYSLHNACERIPKAIDETLKEYENDTI